MGATGIIQNPKDVLTKEQLERFEKAKKTYDAPVLIVTPEEEAAKKEKTRSTKKVTWSFAAENVRDFAFATSRKFIWDAQAVKIGSKTPLAQSLYPKEKEIHFGRRNLPRLFAMRSSCILPGLLSIHIRLPILFIRRRRAWSIR